MQQLTKDRRRHLPVLFVFLGILLFINLFSSTDYSLYSVTVNLRMGLGYLPQTRIVIPPVGHISADTHWLPVRLSLELKSVDLASLRAIVFSPPLNSELILENVRDSVFKILLFFTLKLVGLGTAGAVFFLFFLGVRESRALLWGSLAGALAVLIVVAMLCATYDLQAFERLEYEGMIEAAPWALNLAWQTLGRVEELGDRVQTLASNLYSMLQQLENLGPLGLVQADVLALHVSDIHNNPVAYQFAKQVIDSFPVDFVMDTGDLTDWGTALEAEVTSRIEEMRVPYLFVSGNHESPEVLKRLEAIPNCMIINGEEKTILGLRIVGIGDLAANRYLPTTASLGELAALVEELNIRWAQVENRPDIFMVHNHRVAEGLEPGLFPVVLYGHSHLWGLKQLDDTVYINAGTTGAAGIRGLQSKEPLPYSLSLLYFSVQEEGERPVLQAVDGVHVTGLGMSFSLQRTFLEYGRNSSQDVEVIR